MGPAPLQYPMVECPYCGQPFVVAVDLSAGDQVMTEDCAVCCAPVAVTIHIELDGTLVLAVAREND